MRKVGIWIDRKNAHLVFLTPKGEVMHTVESELEFFRPKGGSGTPNARWGPQDVVQDSKYLERHKHQMKQYFSEVVKHLKAGDSIVLFGPADTAALLRTELETNHHDLAAGITSVHKADSMTDNQVKAWVRDYFATSDVE
ncbi:hypothetical protein SAMN04490243_0654 [Robiginitalea myxolifaciens]|uniref:Protein required for attachment to host cells n=1 Tax=Robiginitalea myxolifaciens TaxID=400055 RepID=A0A1I6FTS0_9FLAO|nr:hypothetical protein [Robiginitalea myxolifaciens]SFR33329.1 hypothetical protein SAMN04490243_0654 [Robiginitalea myxolifaciens]